MKFEDTALHYCFWKLSEEFKKDCLYITIMKTPLFLFFIVVGLPVAIFMDFIGIFYNQ